MSNPVSALLGKSVAGDVSVQDAGLCGMITLRGDLSHKPLQNVCTKLTGAAFPAQGTISYDSGKGLAWMSPDELLIMVAYEDVTAALEAIAKALDGQHHLAVDVSDARAVIRMDGPFVREVAAKLAPVDMHPDLFPVGKFRRSRLGQVAAAFWLQDETSMHVICFRSVAQYTFDMLVASAKAGPVGHLTQAN